jgi:calcineurin-like phosphoesterase family protein
MRFWILADTHLGHRLLETAEMGARPRDFEALIVQNTAKVIRSEDVLIHLGDVSLYRHEKWHYRLLMACPCKRWLIRGNHDDKSVTWYMTVGWNFVGDEIKLKTFGKSILLSHERVCDRDDFDLNVHGHSHTKGLQDNYTHVLVKMEHEYRPFDLRTLVEETCIL